MYLSRFRSLAFLVGLFVLAVIAFSTGCGGGSQSVGVRQVDTIGISSTLKGFFQSLRTGDPKAFFSPTLKAQSSCGEAICTLKILDFGSDINDPNDNYTHYFTIPHDGINQLTNDYAKAYAVKDFSGRIFRVDFELVKIDEQWFIETIKFSGNTTDVIIASSLLPLQRGNQWNAIVIPANYSDSITSPMMVISSIPDDPVILDSRSVYDIKISSHSTTLYFNLSNYSDTLTALKTTDSWPKLREAFYNSNPNVAISIRSAFMDIFTQPHGDHRIRYSNDNGLYIYGPSNFNTFEAFKYLSATPQIGEIATQTLTVQWFDGNAYQVFLASRLARKIRIQTFAGPFEAYQVDLYARFIGSVPPGQTQEMFVSNLYTSNVGLVAQVEWDGNAEATYIHLLHFALVNNTTFPPLDAGTIPASELTIGVTHLVFGTVNEPYNMPLEVTGGVAPLSISLDSGSSLPEGLTLDQTELKITGTPITAGDYSFTIIAADSTGKTVSKTFRMEVVEPLRNVELNSLPYVLFQTPYYQQLILGGKPPYSYNFSQPLPVGLTLDSNGYISGTTYSSPGDYVVAVSVVDSFNISISSLTFTLSIIDKFDVAPTIKLQKVYSATSNTNYNDKLAEKIIPTSDGGFFVVGHVSDANSSDSDVWLMKIDENGTIIWQSVLGGTGRENAVDVVEADNGNFIIVGSTNSTSGTITTSHGSSFDLFVLSVTSSGVLNWVRSYGGANDEDGFAVEKIVFPAPSLVVAGRTFSHDGDLSSTNMHYNGSNYSDMWVMRLDHNNGDIIWQQAFGGSLDDQGRSIAVLDSENLLFVTGSSASADGDRSTSDALGNNDVWVIKLDTSSETNFGQLLGQYSFGGTGDDIGYACKYDGINLLVTGETGSSSIPGFRGNTDVYILKIDLNGTAVWQKAVGSSNVDKGSDIQFLPDHSVIIAGYCSSSDGDVSSFYNNKDAWLLKLDSSGTVLNWEKNYGGSGSEVFRSIVFRDNTLTAVGSTNSIDHDLDTLRTDNTSYDCWLLQF